MGGDYLALQPNYGLCSHTGHLQGNSEIVNEIIEASAIAAEGEKK